MKSKKFIYGQIYRKLLKMMNENFSQNMTEHQANRFDKINNLFDVLEKEKRIRCRSASGKW